MAIYLGKLEYFTHLNSSAIKGDDSFMGLGRSEVVIKFTQIYTPFPFKINYQWLFMS